MEEIKKIAFYNILYDYYNSLLTKKQKDYFIMYFQKDYSLKEVADFYDVTRNAVYSAITTTIDKLKDYEKKLNLHEKSELRKKYYLKYKETKDESWLKKMMEVEENYGL